MVSVTIHKLYKNGEVRLCMRERIMTAAWKKRRVERARCKPGVTSNTRITPRFANDNLGYRNLNICPRK